MASCTMSSMSWEVTPAMDRSIDDMWARSPSAYPATVVLVAG